ncbi:hypothetical protein SAMN04488078_101380 [Antarctobacter heliothermus]|uniref:Uncharacterized protein n=1 Tax=Antarctobacter heliothermus TaxID=74033 RepID=A0A239E877_9RHOB|nr:hypothetical protein SAMN04488078_101380 [Antarctobacter heliothermus]
MFAPVDWGLSLPICNIIRQTPSLVMGKIGKAPRMTSRRFCFACETLPVYKALTLQASSRAASHARIARLTGIPQ